MLPLLEALLRTSPKVKSFHIIFPNLPNFPHHHHDSRGNITESSLTVDPTADLSRVLNTL